MKFRSRRYLLDHLSGIGISFLGAPLELVGVILYPLLKVPWLSISFSKDRHSKYSVKKLRTMGR